MIVITEPNRRFRTSVVEQLSKFKEPSSKNGLVEVAEAGELERIVSNGAGDVEVALIGPGLAAQDALSLASRLQAQAPEVSVILISAGLSGELLHAALRAGVRDVLPQSFTSAQLNEAVERALGLSRSLRGRGGLPSENAASRGKVVVVFSGKGGCGKSFVSTNLAVLIAQTTGQEVALVDLDLQSGDLAIMLQLSPKWTIQDASSRLEGLDAEELAGYLTPHQSGVRLLAAPFEPQDADGITGSAVHAVLGILRDSFKYVVVDGPSSFNDPVLAAIDESDECVLMTSMDVPSIKNLKMSLRTLTQLGVDRERLRLVLNRADSKVGLHLKEVEESLGTSIDVSLPSSRDVPLSINQGVPLALQNRKSPVVPALATLAEIVTAGAAGGRGSSATARAFKR